MMGLKCVQCDGTVCLTCHKFRGQAVVSQRLTFVCEECGNKNK